MTEVDPEVAFDADDEPLTAEVPPEYSGWRLDMVCARLFDQYSRARLQKWITEGRVKVDGEVQTRSRDPVVEGGWIALDAVPLPDHRVEPQAMPLEIIHADDDVAVIYKPAGLTVHPGAGQRDGTLQNALLHHFSQTNGIPRAGIVHRLDKDTSGLLMVALTLEAHASLVDQLAARTVQREYDAVTQGPLISGGTIDAPIGRHPRERTKMAVVPRGGREAVTHYRVEQHFGHHTHVRVQLETGRTHQIRVHFAHIRHPLVGDLSYGAHRIRGGGLDESLRELLANFDRQALHARTLGFVHPRSGLDVVWSRPPPPDMLELLDALTRLDPRDE